MGLNAHGIGHVTPVHHPDRKCRWCRRTFTPSPYNQSATQRYDKPACGTAWRSRKRTLERLRDAHSKIQIAVRESGHLADAVDEAALAGAQVVDAWHGDRWAEKLAHIVYALQRLQDGAYGLCDECGASIPGDRLAAVPWAARCVRCEERAA